MPTQRRRSRNPGGIDPAIADTVSPPLSISWVAGRFYDSTHVIPNFGTGLMQANTYCLPILIPHPVTVTSIGVEATVASSASGLLRFAIYDSDPVSCMPNLRMIDAGTVASDTTGFLAASISVVLKAGWHWLCAVNSASPTTVTVRMYGTTSNAVIGAYQIACIDVPASLPAIGFRMTPTGGIVSAGFPYRFFSGAQGSADILFEPIGQNFPRIMIGV